MPEGTIVNAPVIYFSSKHCTVGKKRLDNVGVLLDCNLKPVTIVTDYLAYRRFKNKGRPETVKVEGRILRMFWERLSREKIDFLDVTDKFLIQWSNDMQNGIRVCLDQKPDPSKKDKNAVLPVDNALINQRISAVVAFFVWGKEERRIPSHIIGDPSAVEDDVYQITVTRSAKTNQLYWPYHLKDTRSPRQPTPSDTDVQKLRKQIEQNHTDPVYWRNSLAVSWMETVGLREVEVTSLRIDQIPNREEIDHLLETESSHLIVLSEKAGNKTKGGYTRELYADPLLIAETHDYIKYFRGSTLPDFRQEDRNPDPDTIVGRFKEKNRNYKEPSEIFLSMRDGNPIKVKTFANELGKAFKDASVPGSPHGLRRKFAFDVVERLYTGMLLEKKDHRKIDENTVIFMAKELLGHKNASTTLRHYLDLVKIKILKLSKAERFAYAEKRAAIASRLVAEKQKKLSEIHEKLNSHKELLVAIQQEDKDLVFKLAQKILSTCNL